MNMTEENNQVDAAAQGGAPAGQIQLQKIYTKDVSFETPNAWAFHPAMRILCR